MAFWQICLEVVNIIVFCLLFVVMPIYSYFAEFEIQKVVYTQKLADVSSDDYIKLANSIRSAVCIKYYYFAHWILLPFKKL